MCIVVNQRRRSLTSLWAYAYQIVPAQPTRRLDPIRALLDHESAAARKEARIWASRLVLEQQATRILVVSDRPEHVRGIDHTLANEVQRLRATFTCTEAMEIGDAVERATRVAHAGNGR